MKKGKVFYTKCRPQNCDAWKLAQKTKRIFIGYPLLRKGLDKEDYKNRTKDLKEIFFDISNNDHKNKSNYARHRRGYKAQSTKHHNLAQKIGTGSVVLVPRIQNGVCYAGKIESEFELIDNPEWIDYYLELRKEQNLKTDPIIDHVGDVIQTWQVKRWHKISFPAIPRWISYRLLSRNTAGIIHDLDKPKTSAIEVLNDIINLPEEKQYKRIRNTANIYETLLNWITPRSFEPLMISILRCESTADEKWYLVGGSGDGGVDGIAVNSKGKMTKALQCKLFYSHSVKELVRDTKSKVQKGTECIIAILGGKNETTEIDGVKIYGIDKIAQLIKKHRNRLPIASILNLV